eukprot:Anaeramoba_ignava/a218880_59.p1 GENE.a218880_59~~a218880_59.p1  ORF type:complete len:822 (+),score=274.37 a218880_59:115-2580(+)
MSSRLIVKNLPKYIDEKRLREHFSTQGEITDIKLKRTQKGATRRFAFIGYKTEEQAKQAYEYFRNTYFDTSKLEVSFAKPIGSNDIERPWSKYSKGSSLYYQAHPEIQKQKKLEVDLQRKKKYQEMQEKKQKVFNESVANDPKLVEFLQVMKPRSNTKKWTNDEILKLKPVIKKKRKVGNFVEEEEMSIVSGSLKKNKNQIYTRRHKRFIDDEDPEKGDNLIGKNEEKDANQKSIQNDSNIFIETNSNSNVPVDNDFNANQDDSVVSIAFDDGVSDFEYFSSKKKEKLSDEIELNKNGKNEKENEEQVEDSLVAKTGRLFVKNIPFTTTEEELSEFFGEYGTILETHIPLKKETKQPYGIAFVLFKEPIDAVSAFEELNGKFFQGRILQISAAKEEVEEEKDEDNDSGAKDGMRRESKFQRKKQKERKKNAENTINWNSIFLSSDTVAEAVSKNLNISKSQLLDPQSSNMAVRLSLAETSVISETKAYLEKEGVNLDSFNGLNALTKRSKTTILVKNLPFSTEKQEIEEIFSKFGSIKKIIIPPTKAVALVEFIHPTEAKKALRSLAYRKYRHVPLFLEWAPLASLKSNDEKKDENKSKIMKQNLDESLKLTDQDSVGSTLFVKNLSFETDEEKLREVFQNFRVKSVKISRKKDVKTGELASMGFGFIDFENKNEALKAIKQKQSVVVDERELVLEFSKSRGKSGKLGKKKNRKLVDLKKLKGTKLLVRNIPFEATRKEIRELFGSFGEIKSVRIPKKFDGSHRGFGFVDFVTKQEAENARSALLNTHLYGRHLVVEEAKDDKSIDEIRNKVGKKFGKQMK